ncbi:hypothetical protein A1Q1_02773 [Trichosporon asahii var. asahii CBS 2479]|uniref:Uncharacterized protein n=1 Tax=Trichosporon asahii var. asahii (strain ATCC 90039 / CBS 2479 / JCM 2466 / KCTC 7840 / NBRC 103889/ NCYC 2677 / UAMH 7654) TaxID=1186058 RepID=J6EZB0_TRIAS|nr:hypothetical protein A1Q1_02773 [Trichosporon asahii var. asahii CBS 2479]EJT48207.1 hypothetical protein A1Q1_02773 [Trichosporon asahii var. asahii CBS 2479]
MPHALPTPPDTPGSLRIKPSPRLHELSTDTPVLSGTWPRNRGPASGRHPPRADSLYAMESSLQLQTSTSSPTCAYGPFAAFAECRAILARADASFVYRSGELARLEAVAYVVEVFSAAGPRPSTVVGGEERPVLISPSARSSSLRSSISSITSLTSSPFLGSPFTPPSPTPIYKMPLPVPPSPARPKTSDQVLLTFRRMLSSPPPTLRLFLSKHPALSFAFEPNGLEYVAPPRLAVMRIPQSSPALVLHDLLVLDQHIYTRSRPSHSPVYPTNPFSSLSRGIQDPEGFGVWRTIAAYLAAILAKEGESSVRDCLGEVRDLARERSQARRAMRDGSRRHDRQEVLPTARQNALLKSAGLPHLTPP